jgi:hypothetical protein
MLFDPNPRASNNAVRKELPRREDALHAVHGLVEKNGVEGFLVEAETKV